MKTRAKSIALALAILLPSFTAADVIIMQDGSRLEGRVVEASDATERIAFISSSGRVELSRDRISEIIEEEDYQDFTHLGQQYLQAGNYSSAIQRFQKALEANPEAEVAKEGLEEAQAAISAQQQQMQRDERQEIDSTLEEISELIAENEYSEKRYTEVEKQLDTIMTSSTSTEQQRQSAQRLMRDLYLAWAFARFDRLDYSGAEELYTRVLEMDPDNEEAREKLLVIWRDDPSKKPEVLKAYQQKLKEEPNNLELNKTVGNLLYEMQRYREAIDPLTKVAAAGRYAGQGYEERLQNAYRFSVQNLRGQGKLQEALDLLKEMFALGLTQDKSQLDRLEYEIAVAKLPEGDDYWRRRAQLAREYLGGPGLDQMLEDELLLALKSDPENEVALSGLRERAEERIQKIQTAMREGEYLVARNRAQRFLETENRFPELVEQASELYNKADLEAERAAKAARETAKQIAENGIQYYQQALRDVENMINQETLRQEAAQAGDRSFSFMSFKQSAINNADNAIERFELALKYDPTLGGPTGMDLEQRIRDAKQLKRRLQEPGRRLPTVRNR